MKQTMEERFLEKFTDTFWAEVCSESHFGDVDTRPFIKFIKEEIKAGISEYFKDTWVDIDIYNGVPMYHVCFGNEKMVIQKLVRHVDCRYCHKL